MGHSSLHTPPAIPDRARKTGTWVRSLFLDVKEEQSVSCANLKRRRTHEAWEAAGVESLHFQRWPWSDTCHWSADMLLKMGYK